MRVIALKRLRDFWAEHPDAEQPLRAWHEEVSAAHWPNPAALEAQYRNASVLKGRRVVFNIKGNDYRLMVSVAYGFGAVCIKWVGSHADYDRIDAEGIEA